MAGRMTKTALITTAFAAPLAVVADLGASLRRSTDSPASWLPSNAPLAEGSYLTVPLQSSTARHLAGAHGTDQEKLYTAEVSIGHPGQALSILIDTSSGNVILPHRACGSAACVEHRRYSPWESSSAIDVNFRGEAVESGSRLLRGKHRREGMTLTYTQSDLGQGNATTVVVRDQLCLEKERCVDMGFLAAIQLDEKPFRALPSDGILGLGLDGLVAAPICSFFSRLLEGSHQSLPPFFGLALNPSGGELHLGGTDERQYQGSLQWFPVDHAALGFWQIPVKAVYLGDQLVDDCATSCHAIIDTGVARLGVQEAHVPNLRTSLRAHCRSKSPLKFALAPSNSISEGTSSSSSSSSSTWLEVPAEVYGDEACEPLLGDLPLEEPDFVGVYAFGTAVLQRYYTAFDWGARRWGFAPRQEQQLVV